MTTTHQPGQCASCGAANPAGARFCNQCGTRLEDGSAAGYTPKHLQETLQQGAGLQGERKRVTVLFADIKGSTRLAEEAGAERWHEVLDRFFAILTRAVHQYAGTLNQYTGDGIMALFGAPRALEDHALFAAHAALQMQRDVRRYADELRLSFGLNLSMRVGLNSGEVVVGQIGDGLRSDYTAQGATVHLAARMEHLCEPGRVYLTRETADLLEGYFRLRSLGAAQVHGVDEAVDVFELEGSSGIRTRLDRTLARSGSPFIGREAERSRLAAAWEQVRAGSSQVVAVVGNAGIGKSRLCHEFTTACARDGATVIRTTGVPYASRVPLFPIRQLLRAKLRVPEDATAEETRRWVAGELLLEDQANAAVLPHVFEFLNVGEGVEHSPETGMESRQRMMQRLAEYLPCDDHPVILLIEDLHFFDHASEEFLVQLCQAVRASSCLLLLNFRPDYLSEWLQPLVDESIPVGALTVTQLEQMARTLLGDDPTLDHAVRVIAQRSGGNPFFVEEAVQSLADGGWLEGHARSWRLARPIEEWPVPDSVQALLAARIDRLPERQRQRLQTAAVIGLEFDPEMLAELDPVNPAATEDDLAMLEESGFVHTRDDKLVAFCHPMVQDVAYRGQLESHRRTIHGRIAALFEARQESGGPRACAAAVSIANHWQRAGEWTRAGAWNLAAASWAMSQDIATTEDQFRRALANFDRAEPSPEVLHGRVSARAGMVRMAQFAPVSEEEVERAYREGLEIARASGDIRGRAELLISYGNELLHRGDVDAAACTHEEAIELCFDNGQSEFINRFRLAVMLSYNAAGRLRRILEILDIAGGDWRTCAVDENNYLARAFYGLMLCWMGRLDEAAAHLDAAIEFAERKRRVASWMYGNRVDLALLSGQFGPALQAAIESLAQAERFGSPYFRAIALRAYGLALSMNGRHEEALEAFREGEPLVKKGGYAHQFEANHLASHAAALYSAHQVDEAEAKAREARASAQRAGSRIWEIVAWLVWLRLPVSVARRAEATQGLARLRELIDFTGAEGFRPWLLLVEAHWSQQPEQRESLRQQAQRAFETIGAHAFAQRLAERRARAAATMSEST